MAIDSANDKLYVTDAAHAAIISIDLEHYEQEYILRLAKGSKPRAIAFDFSKRYGIKHKFQMSQFVLNLYFIIKISISFK